MSREIVDRIMPTLTELVGGHTLHLVEKLEKLCDSPIEIMLGTAILMNDRLNPMPNYPICLARQQEEKIWPSGARLLMPQYRFLTYRIDWALREEEGQYIFIECDGHQFHDRTKVQAARDKQRDRAIQQAGHPILRFTGSEINKDPTHCASQVIEFMNERLVPKEYRTA